MTPAALAEAARLCHLCARGFSPAALYSGDKRIGWVHPERRGADARLVRESVPCKAAAVWERGS